MFCRISITFLAIIANVNSELVDLSYGFDNLTLRWPGGAKFHYINQFTGKGNGNVFFAANDFVTAEHCGTHIDAPYHFNKEGKTVEQMPLEKFFVKGVFVNATKETGDNDTFLLGPESFKNWESENGAMPQNSVVLVTFGWSKRYPNKTAYMGPSDDDLRFPGLTAEAGKWLVDSKKVVGIGVDTLSPDDPKNPDAPVHVQLTANDMYILENVNLSHPLPPLFDLVVLPMKLVNGTGGPVRIVAIL